MNKKCTQLLAPPTVKKKFTFPQTKKATKVACMWAGAEIQRLLKAWAGEEMQNLPVKAFKGTKQHDGL